EIMERQDEIIARRHNLRLAIAHHRSSIWTVVARVTVENLGTRSARDLYWDFWVPRDGLANWDLVDHHGNSQRRDFVQIEGALYLRFRVYYDLPIYPHRSVQIGEITVHMSGDMPSSMKVLWQITAEDGLFPEGEPAAVTLAIDRWPAD